MRLRFLSLGLLALQIGASVVPVDPKGSDLAGQVATLNENAARGVEPPTIPVENILEKRQKKGKGGSGGATKPKNTPAKVNKPKATPAKTPNKGTKPSPSPGKKPSPSPTKGNPIPPKSQVTKGATKTQALTKSGTKSKSASSMSRAKLVHTPVPTWPSKLQPATACAMKKPRASGKAAAGKPAAGKPATGKQTATKPKTGRSLVARASKRLNVGIVELPFPNYPTGGDVIRSARYQGLVIAYGADDPNPCNQNLRFGTLPHPKFNTPYGEHLDPSTGDMWNGEHVLDAQVVANFFASVMSSSKTKNNIGRGLKKASGHKKNPSVQEWFREFWNDRLQASTQYTAMSYLLEAYPGTHQYTNEMTLLGGRINNKKQAVFGGKSCIGGWSSLSWVQKMDQIHLCIHLSSYISHPSIRSHMSGVANRLEARFTSIESSSGFMNSIKTKSDAAGETWKSLGLAALWHSYVRRFVRGSVTTLDSDLRIWIADLERILADQRKFLIDTTKALEDTERKARIKAGEYDYYRDRQAYDEMTAWQNKYRVDKDTQNQIVNNYNTIKADVAAIKAAWRGTTSPL